MEEVFLLYRRILIIGPVDSGKSFLFRKIIELWKKRGYRFTAIDTDVGQSTLGLPTTITSMNREGKQFFFYGFSSPRAHPFRFLSGVSRMNKQGRIVVDTTGYVEFPHGLEIKKAKIEILQPDLVVAFPSSDHSWEEFIASISTKVVKMERDPNVKRRGPKERAIHRIRKFQEFFKKTRETVIPRASLFPVKLGITPEKGALLSFRKANKDLFLGYIKEVGNEWVSAVIPADREPTSTVLFSSYLFKEPIKQQTLF